jgi:L-lactate dehydrogenase complex protein LldG
VTAVSARDRILSRLREARGADPSAHDSERALVEARIREHPVGPRPTMAWTDAVERFRAECVRAASTVDTVATRAEVPLAVARYLVAKQLPTQAVAWPELGDLDWAAADIEIDFRAAQGDDPVGITGAHLAIAETGTLMFLSTPRTHPVTSLLPETHVAVVPASRVVRTMEDAFERTRVEVGALPRATNFVSGPSRTADIEGVLQIGAHGPFRVHVIVVDDRAPPASA